MLTGIACWRPLLCLIVGVVVLVADRAKAEGTLPPNAQAARVSGLRIVHMSRWIPCGRN